MKKINEINISFKLHLMTTIIVSIFWIMSLIIFEYGKNSVDSTHYNPVSRFYK